MVFPVVMYGCESWTINKAEHWRINAFELWCWRRLLRVPWTARRSNQSILKEVNPEYSLEGLMLKLKLQYFGHLMWRTNSFENTLMLERWKAGGEGDDRRWDGWMASSTQWTWVWVSSRSWWWTGNPGMLLSMGSQRVGHDWAAELETYMGFSGGSDSKDSACNVGAPNSILESRDSYNYMCAQNFLFSRSDMRYWDVIQMPCSLLVSHHWLGIYVHVVWKDPDAGKDWGLEKGTTEDEMVGCHHRLNGHEFE